MADQLVLPMLRPRPEAEREQPPPPERVRVPARPVRVLREAGRRLRARPFVRTELMVAALLIAATDLWWGSRDLPLAAMDDLGLGSVFPSSMWAALLLGLVAFLVAVWSGHRPALVASLVTTAVHLHGLGVITEPVMRFSVSWRHLGITDYIATRGAVDPFLDAYQSWPGFFALSAFLREVTGVTDPAAVLAWAPVAVQLLYLLPMFVIARHLLGDGTAAWVATWLFTVTNWIGQDYYSPQGWYLFVYLVLLAVLLTRFRAPVREGTPGRGRTRAGRLVDRFIAPGGTRKALPPDVRSDPRQVGALIPVVALLVLVVVTSHQLTPIALVFVTTALVVVGWTRLTSLPVVIGLALLLWLGTGAAGYVAGHGAEIRAQIGAVSSIFDQTVTERLSGSPGHAVIVRLRLLCTAGLWLLAGLGVLRLARGGRVALATGLAVGAVSTFPMLGVLSYGGEALLRIALFSSPFMVLLAAAALVRSGVTRPRPRGLLLIAVVGLAAVLTFPFTRYGNERMDWYSPDEVATIAAMYEIAPDGAVLTSVTGNLPWRYVEYADHEHRTLITGGPVATNPDPPPSESVDVGGAPSLVVRQTAARMAADGAASFLVVTRNQAAELELLGGEAPGAYERLVADLDGAPQFRVVERTPDSVLYELVGGPS